jgi:hypothetical protein
MPQYASYLNITQVSQYNTLSLSQNNPSIGSLEQTIQPISVGCEFVSSHPTQKIAKINPSYTCPNCSDLMVEISFCRECKEPIKLICASCETVSWLDTHELCFCQPLLMSSIFNQRHYETEMD